MRSRVSQKRRALLAVALALVFANSALADWSFLRGDANGDAQIHISDAIYALNYLFVSGPSICADAMDSNDDGQLNIADAVYLLNYMFIAGPNPPPPFPGCGIDPTGDTLACAGPLAGCPDDLPPPAAPVLDPVSQFTSASTMVLSGTALGAFFVEVETPAGIVSAAVIAGAFVASDVPLQPNTVNNVYATAFDEIGLASPTVMVMVIQDTQPPQLSVQVPAEGAELIAGTVDVMGTISDLLSGALPMTVTVNGTDASVYEGLGTTGSFLAPQVPVTALGAHALLVTATDALGNSTTITRAVVRVELPPGAASLVPISGNAQAGVVRTMLPAPIEVEVRRADGSPFVNKLVTFRVTRNDAVLNTDGGLTGEPTLSLYTDSAGRAAARWRLGSTAGEANNRVEVSSQSVLGTATFCASGAALGATQISIGDGNHQRVETNTTATLPLRVWASDGVNGIPNEVVVFTVVRGGGTINGLAQMPFLTYDSGHAEATFVLGPEPGVQQVEARLGALPTERVVFTVYGIVRDEEAPTKLLGTVLDNANQPLEGATCTLTMTGQNFTAASDADGRFSFDDLPMGGPASVRIDGASVSWIGGAFGVAVPAGSYPAISYPFVVIPDAENRLPQPVLLPPLNPINAAVFDGSSDIELTIAGIDGFKISVPADTTITLADGTIVAAGSGNSIVMSANRVNHDDVPMRVPDGAAPALAWTVQPAGAHFDPPLAIRYPNLSALAPGSITYFLSYNGGNNRFEIVCAGIVSTDGEEISSDPGAGLTIAGWGCNCPPYAINAECEDGQICTASGPAGGGPLSGESCECPCDSTASLIAMEAALTALAEGPFRLFPGGGILGVSYATHHLLRYLDGSGMPLFYDSFSPVVFDIVISDTFATRHQEVLSVLHERVLQAIAAGTGVPNFVHTTTGWCFYPVDALGALIPTQLSYGIGCTSNGFPTVVIQSVSVDTVSGDVSAFATWNLSDLYTFDDGDALISGPDRWGYCLAQCGWAAPFEISISFDTQLTYNLTDPPPLPEPQPFGSGSETSEPSAFLGIAIDQSFQLQYNGESLVVEADGQWHGENISLVDADPVDFASDEAFRVVGVGRDFYGTPVYAQSLPIRLTQDGPNEVFFIDLTYDPPAGLPQELSLSTPGGSVVIETGESLQLTAAAVYLTGVAIDVTAAEDVSYRSTNNAIATVSPSGLVTGMAQGPVIIVAQRDGAAAALRISVVPAVALTTIVGHLQLSAGAPLAGAMVTVIGTAASALSDAGGAFTIPDFELTGDSFDLLFSASVGGATLAAELHDQLPVIGGITDVGLVSLAGGPALQVSAIDGVAGTMVQASVVLDTDQVVRGWSFGLCHDSSHLMLLSATPSQLVLTLQGGAPPDYSLVELLPGSGVTMAVVIDFESVFALPPGVGHWLLEAEYTLTGAPGTTSQICCCDTIGGGGAGPVETVVTGSSGASIAADSFCGTVTIQ